MQPPGEALHRHGLVRPENLAEVGARHLVRASGKGMTQHVDVDDHPGIVETGPLDRYLDAVVVLVRRSFR